MVGEFLAARGGVLGVQGSSGSSIGSVLRGLGAVLEASWRRLEPSKRPAHGGPIGSGMELNMDPERKRAKPLFVVGRLS